MCQSHRHSYTKNTHTHAHTLKFFHIFMVFGVHTDKHIDPHTLKNWLKNEVDLITEQNPIFQQNLRKTPAKVF